MLKLHISASEIESFPTTYGLSNVSEDKLQFTPFLGGPKPGCSASLRIGIIERHSFFVLRHILVKCHIRTRLIKSFAVTYCLWWCAKEKLHFTPVHTLRQLKLDRALFPPLERVVEIRARNKIGQRIKNHSYFNFLAENRKISLD